jgi:predicted dithiol-disulfide oxidoreductase (DUF899 family)
MLPQLELAEDYAFERVGDGGSVTLADLFQPDSEELLVYHMVSDLCFACASYN